MATTTLESSTKTPRGEHTLTLTVAGIREEADGVRSVTLAHADGSALPAWEPGSHIDITVAEGLTRQYSLCSDPSDLSSYRIGVLREPTSRGTSEYIHSTLAEGDTVTIVGPRNNFALASANRYIFIAGGIGVTPLIPMVAAAAASGADYQIVYGGRRKDSMAFIEELAAHGDRFVIWPEDEKGLIDLPGLLGEVHDDTLIYTCGPGPLLGAVENYSSHWPAGALHLERFTPKEIIVTDQLDEFEVELQASGITLTIGPDTTILEAAKGAGVDVFYSCSEGTCGSCETQIIEGEADHRDSVLSAAEQAENTCMMICVSRSKCSKLVLDL